MGRKKQPPGREPKPSVQVSCRMPAALADRLASAADGLGLDTAGLLRMMILEHLPSYEDKAARIAGRSGPDA